MAADAASAAKRRLRRIASSQKSALQLAIDTSIKSDALAEMLQHSPEGDEKEEDSFRLPRRSTVGDGDRNVMRRRGRKASAITPSQLMLDSKDGGG